MTTKRLNKNVQLWVPDNYLGKAKLVLASGEIGHVLADAIAAKLNINPQDVNIYSDYSTCKLKSGEILYVYCSVRLAKIIQEGANFSGGVFFVYFVKNRTFDTGTHNPAP